MNYDLLIAIVIANAVMTLSILLRSLSRAQTKPPLPIKKIGRALWYSKPIEPKHEPPRPTSFPHEWDRRFFFDFASFGSIVNSWLADEFVSSRFRLQELPKSLLSVSMGGPDFGRTYAVFYNRERVGRIQIHANINYANPYSLRQHDQPAPQENRLPPRSSKVSTHIELRWVRLLGYGQIVEFLTALAEHVTDYRLESECASSRQAIKDAMLKALWEMHELSDCMDHHQEWGELSLVLRGTPGHYLGKVAAEQNRRAQELPA